MENDLALQIWTEERKNLQELVLIDSELITLLTSRIKVRLATPVRIIASAD